MIIKLEMKSEVPLYVQLRNQIVLGIGKGELRLGETLPTIRQLANDIGVNNMTISKAYSILKKEGFIETDRRNGAKVIIDKDTLNENYFREKLEGQLQLLITEAKLSGCSSAEILEKCKQMIEGVNVLALEGR